MGKLLTEKAILKKLGIVDFRHLTKEKVITMASMLNKMHPEVAKKVLEQFPEFTSTMKELVSNYKDVLNQCLESHKNSVQNYYDTCNSIIEVLQKQLEEENLSLKKENI